MTTAMLVIVAAGAAAIGASWIMWRATARNAAWAMAAGAVMAFAAIACAVLIAWILTRALYGD